MCWVRFPPRWCPKQEAAAQHCSVFWKWLVLISLQHRCTCLKGLRGAWRARCLVQQPRVVHNLILWTLTTILEVSPTLWWQMLAADGRASFITFPWLSWVPLGPQLFTEENIRKCSGCPGAARDTGNGAFPHKKNCGRRSCQAWSQSRHNARQYLMREGCVGTSAYRLSESASRYIFANMLNFVSVYPERSLGNGLMTGKLFLALDRGR